MDERWSSGGDADLAMVRFLADLEEDCDPEDVVRRYGEAYPELADEFRAVMATRRLLAGSVGPEPFDGPPERLGDFRIVRQLAVGGMGVVYEAVQHPFGRRVAVKTIRRGGRPIAPAMHDRFLREQEVLARLHHTHIVPIHAAGREGDLLYYAMPYIAGATLGHLIESLRGYSTTHPEADTPSLAELAEANVPAPTPAPLPSPDPSAAGPDGRPPSEPDGELGATPVVRHSTRYLRSVAQVMADAADALDHAHRAGVVHRDLKPSNLMVDRDEHSWVVDFGLARLHEASDAVAEASAGPEGAAELHPATDSRAGTRLYMAPEQYEGRADARTDVWGLGVTLYELLTLRRAFDHPRQIPADEPRRPRALVRDLPADLDAICWKALRKDPDHRYQTAADFADDLRRWLRFEPIRARPARPLRRAALWARRNKGWAAAIALGLGVILTGMAAWTFNAQAAERRRSHESLVHVLRIQRIRLLGHAAGWSADAWALARDAARIRPDPELQSQAAATLAGLDARKIEELEVAAASLAFHPDPARDALWIGGPDGDALVRDGEAERPRRLATTGLGPFAFLPDGTMVQVVRDAEDDAALLLIEPESGAVRRRLVVPDAGLADIVGVAIAPEGSHVAAAVRSAEAAGNRVVVWDAETGRDVLSAPATQPTSVALAGGGVLVASGSAGGTVALWTVPDGEAIGPFVAGHAPIRCLAFAPDRERRLDDGGGAPAGSGWLLAAGDAGGEMTVWDVGDRAPMNRYRGSVYALSSVAFSSDGTTLASAGRNDVKLWDLAGGRLLLDLAGYNYVNALAFAPDGRRLAVAWWFPHDDSYGVTVWELVDGRAIRTLRGLGGHVEQVAFSPDGRRIAALAQDWQVGIWERGDGRLVCLLDVPPAAFTDNAGLAFSADGRRFALSAGRSAGLWDLETGDRLGTWTLPEGVVDRLVFLDPDRLRLHRVETKGGQAPPYREFPAARFPRVVVTRELQAPGRARVLSEIEDFDAHVNDAALSADGATLAVEGLLAAPGGRVRSVRLYDAATGRRLWTLPSQQPADSAGAHLGFDPTGRVLSVALARGVSTLLDVPARDVLGEQGSQSNILGPGAERWVAFDPPSPDRSVGLVLRERGRAEPLITFIRDRPGNCPPRFSPDGRHIAWGHPDGSVNVADLAEVQRRLTAIELGW